MKEDMRWPYLMIRPRYSTLVQVDEASLRSVVEHTPFPTPAGAPADCAGHVNLVDMRWKPDPDHNEFSEPCEIYEEIEGITEEDVGWMKIQTTLLTPEFYVGIGGSWHTFYIRPPEVVSW